MHALQPHLVPRPAPSPCVCTSRSACRTAHFHHHTLQRNTPQRHSTPAQQLSRSWGLQSSSQSHAELADHPQPSEEPSVEIDASVEALLTAEGEAEGEDLSELDVEAYHEEQQQVQQEQNPYSPEDAARCVCSRCITYIYKQRLYLEETVAVAAVMASPGGHHVLTVLVTDSQSSLVYIDSTLVAAKTGSLAPQAGSSHVYAHSWLWNLEHAVTKHAASQACAYAMLTVP